MVLLNLPNLLPLIIPRDRLLTLEVAREMPLQQLNPPVMPSSPRTFSFCNFHRVEMPDVVRSNTNFEDDRLLDWV